MKRCPPTEEDGDIWWEVLMRLKTRKDTSARSLFYVSEDCDRRDVELMFERQVHLKAKREMMRRQGWIAHPWIGLRLL